MPLRPVPIPSMNRPRSWMVSPTPALMMMPFVPDTRTPASPTPSLIMLIALVMVTAPKPPGSSTLISPPAAVFEIAPGKLLQGAVRLHGLASSPTPYSHVRVAWACAGTELSVGTQMRPTAASSIELRIAFLLLPGCVTVQTPSAHQEPDSTDGCFSCGETVPVPTMPTPSHISVAVIAALRHRDSSPHEFWKMREQSSLHLSEHPLASHCLPLWPPLARLTRPAARKAAFRARSRRDGAPHVGRAGRRLRASPLHLPEHPGRRSLRPEVVEVLVVAEGEELAAAGGRDA